MAVAMGSLPYRAIGLDERSDLERRETEERLELHNFMVALVMTAISGNVAANKRYRRHLN